MGRPTGFVLLSLLLLCFHDSCFAHRKKCRSGGRINQIDTFFGQKFYVTFPCRYKVANLHCGGSQTVIYADHSFDDMDHRDAYMTGVTVNITTEGGDGVFTSQIFTISNVTLGKYIKKKKFKRSPWNMDYTGTSKLRRKDRIDSRYYRKAKNAIIVDGGLKVEFHYVDPMSRRHNGGRDRTTLLIMCYDRHFKVYEPFPQTLCGDRDIEPFEAVKDGITLDPHHVHWLGNMDDYYLAVQNVRQPNALCQQAADMAAEQLGDMDKLYDCKNVYAALSWTRGPRAFEIYVTCLRVMFRSNSDTLDTDCETIQQVADEFHWFFFLWNIPPEKLLARSFCPVVAATEVPEQKNTEMAGTCRADYTYGRFSPFSKEFYNQYRRVLLPCRYKMSNILCGRSQSVIYADYTIDSSGYTFISGVIVDVITPKDDGTEAFQTLSINSQKFQQYIDEENFDTSPWQRTYKGDKVPKAEDLIAGNYMHSPQGHSAYLMQGGLSVTYTQRGSQAVSNDTDVFSIECIDQVFKANEEFPEALCGGMYVDPKHLRKHLADDDTDHPFGEDIIYLSRQNVQQTSPLCEEAVILVSGDCGELAHKLYECYWIYKDSDLSTSYSRCLSSHSIDVLKVYVSCLRVLCKARGSVTWADTCATLSDAANSCGGYKGAHMKITDLLKSAECTSNTATQGS